MTVGGMLGAGLTYMDARLERHLHDRLCGLKLKLVEEPTLHAESFSVYDTGFCTIYLTTVNTIGSPLEGRTHNEPSTQDDTLKEFQSVYHGAIDMLLSDPAGEIVWKKRVDGHSISLALPP